MTTPLSFYNDSAFLRVENAATGVTAYFNKANLTFQADAETSFFLKSDTLQTYYLYDEVSRPESTSIKHLMEIFQEWVQTTAAGQDLKPLVGESTSTVLEVKTFYDKDPLRIAELAAGSGSTSFDAGKNAVLMSITDAAESRVVRQTKEYATVINNKTTYAVVAATMVSDATARNLYSKAGVFDESDDITFVDSLPSGNGVFFEHKSTTGLSLVLRSNFSGSQVDTVVPQSSWNMDTLDGLGGSGVDLDPAVENTFVFEWSALKGNVIRAGILRDGFAIFCHKFQDVRMGCASVPLRWEIGRLDAAAEVADNDAAYMIQSGATVMIQGNNEFPTVTRAKSNEGLKPVTTANTPLPIWSLRLRPATNRAHIKPRRLRIMNLDSGIAKWSIVLNPSLTGSSFDNVGNGSYAQFSDAETVVSSGVVLASGFFSDAGVQVVDLDEQALGLASSIDGTPDVLTLVVKYMRGVVTVSSSIEWAETE